MKYEIGIGGPSIIKQRLDVFIEYEKDRETILVARYRIRDKDNYVDSKRMTIASSTIHHP